jgi:hypothetical protein
MPFVDGEPIDAAKLGALETKLNQLESKIPTFGGSNTSISLDNSTTNISTGPEIEAAEVTGISVTSSKKTYEVSFRKTFSKRPIVVISMRGGESSYILSARVLTNSVSENGFKYVISAPENAYTGKTTAKIAINYIAIAY